jgi:hypothetical protein
MPLRRVSGWDSASRLSLDPAPVITETWSVI